MTMSTTYVYVCLVFLRIQFFFGGFLGNMNKSVFDIRAVLCSMRLRGPVCTCPSRNSQFFLVSLMTSLFCRYNVLNQERKPKKPDGDGSDNVLKK